MGILSDLSVDRLVRRVVRGERERDDGAGQRMMVSLSQSNGE